MRISKSRSLWFFTLSLTFFISGLVHAGSYIFASEGNGPDYIVHPQGYSGSEDTVTVRVCIDPTSPNAQQMEYSIQNNIAAYNQLTPTIGNLKSGSNNNIPANTVDFESVALHEIGHCLGLAHVNVGSGLGPSGNDTNYTRTTDGLNDGFDINAGTDSVIGSGDDVRGDDVNLVWFRRSNNDPFTIDAVVDSTTYSRNVADLPSGNFAANADRAVSTFLGYPQSEAVMQQGSYADEAQRELGHDDVAALRYAASGINERESGANNANDNYTVVLEYGGISTSNCDVNMSFTGTASLASCDVNGTWIATNHISLTSADIQFGQGFTWFFNAPNTAPVLDTIGDISLLDGDILVVDITATDVDANTLSFSESGLPLFANLIDNGDGTATLTISPSDGEDSVTSVTVTVSDNANTADTVLTASETFDIEVLLDTDNDGLSDVDEINIYGTSPTNPDSDGDNLTDYEEVILYGTSPNDTDSDNDFIDDFDEVTYGSDPLDDTSWPNYADGDIAPLGSPDGLINAADYLIANRIVLGDITATSLELSHGDLYPAGSPDGIIDASDLILLLQLINQ